MQICQENDLETDSVCASFRTVDAVMIMLDIVMAGVKAFLCLYPESLTLWRDKLRLTA